MYEKFYCKGRYYFLFLQYYHKQLVGINIKKKKVNDFITLQFKHSKIEINDLKLLFVSVLTSFQIKKH